MARVGIQHDYSIEFDEFWRLYPRKVKKIGAEKAYKLARKIASAAQILAGLRVYEFSANRKYQEHAASWLNAGGWMNEVDTAPPTVMVERNGHRHEGAELAESLNLDLLTPIDQQYPMEARHGDATSGSCRSVVDQTRLTHGGREDTDSQAADRPLRDDAG